MKTKTAMKQQGLKYFSNLNTAQKTKTILYLRIFKNKLSKLSTGLAKEILKNRELQVVIDENVFFDEKLKGQKCFLFKDLGCYLPLNFKDIIA